MWTGKLTLPMKLMVNTSNIMAWLTGNTRDTGAMKERVKSGYDGAATSHVTRYDELGLQYQVKAAQSQLEDLDVAGKHILDVGAGTGSISFLLLERGAARVTCGDISDYMLDQCRRKAAAQGFGSDRIDFRVLDAENLPFEDNSFDMTLTGMTLGLLPDQQKAVAEMVRVTKQDGLVSVGAHGPEHYWEPIDTYFRAITKRYVLGYRLEWWPMDEEKVRSLMAGRGLSDIRTKRIVWRNRFPTGADACDFFTAISSSWWYARFPEEKRLQDARKVRDYFDRKNKNVVTDDIILAYGRKA